MSKDCSKCGAQNPETAKFCVACGNSLSQPTKCPKCNEKIEKNYKFCPKCGNSLSNPQGTSNIPYDQSLNLIRHLPQPQSQPQSVISQLVKEQFGLRAS